MVNQASGQCDLTLAYKALEMLRISFSTRFSPAGGGIWGLRGGIPHPWGKSLSPGVYAPSEESQGSSPLLNQDKRGSSRYFVYEKSYGYWQIL
jgi:hypothetical protein